MQLDEIKRLHFQTITSTNDYLKEIINDYDKLVITADFQTAGRGRNNKVWEGKYGLNVYFSFGINHKKISPFKNFSYYQLIGALASQLTLKKLTKLDQFRIKYPNDIHFVSKEVLNNKSQKISGVLAEHNFMGGELISTIIGIGINVSQKDFNDELIDIATSLLNLGFDIGTEEIIEELINNIQLLLKANEDELFAEWSSLLNLYNKDITIINKDGIYRLKTIMKDCRLLLTENNTNNEIIIDNGDSIRYNLF